MSKFFVKRVLYFSDFVFVPPTTPAAMADTARNQENQSECEETMFLSYVLTHLRAPQGHKVIPGRTHPLHAPLRECLLWCGRFALSHRHGVVLCPFEKFALYVPCFEREKIMDIAHCQPEGQHVDGDEMMEIIQREGFWFGMEWDIMHFIQSCERCADKDFALFSYQTNCSFCLDI